MQQRALDFSTLIGIFSALLFIVAAIMVGGNSLSFVDIPSILIVFFGTLAVTIACFSLKEIVQAILHCFRVILYNAEDVEWSAMLALRLADQAYRKGILSLEKEEKNYQRNSFLTKGLVMVVDGLVPDAIEKILQQTVRATSERHQRMVSIIRKAAEIAPAMGLIGTLIGLVQMLSSLNDVSKIGPAMAVALLTTFYGAILAYVVLFPLASKLERNSREEMLVATVFQRAIISIAKKENPRHLEIMINNILPAHKRINYFE